MNISIYEMFAPVFYLKTFWAVLYIGQHPWSGCITEIRNSIGSASRGPCFSKALLPVRYPTQMTFSCSLVCGGCTNCNYNKLVQAVHKLQPGHKFLGLNFVYTHNENN
jgi:hypothetical protein